MGKRRKRVEGVVELPSEVQIVRKSAKTYYYWAPKRGAREKGGRSPLPSDPRDPAFWEAVRKAQGFCGVAAGTFAALIGQYRSSPEYTRLRPASKRDYELYLTKIEAWWGKLPVDGLRPVHIIARRDEMGETAVAANHMLSVLRTVIKWGIPREYRDDDPTAGVPKLKVDDDGARPWPEEIYNYVLANAPQDIRRAVFLMREIGQRVSDTCRLRPADRDGNGIRFRIGKRREKEHWAPLTTRAILEIDGWGVELMKPYFAAPSGRQYDQQRFGARWNRWLKTEIGKTVKAASVTLHGLRAHAVCDRRLAGLPDGKIADQIGMSVQMVSRYARFADKRRNAESGVLALESFQNRGTFADNSGNVQGGLKTLG